MAPNDRLRRPRRNSEIRISPIRVIGPDGQQIGVISAQEARDQAEALGLDLVEISPNVRPPVCRIMDYGKHLYEEGKKARAAKRKQHESVTKEIQLRPTIGAHDLDIKIRHAQEFLEDGNRVNFVLRFKGREITHSEIGKAVINKVIEQLAAVGMPQSRPAMDGKMLSVLIAPKGRNQTVAPVAAPVVQKPAPVSQGNGANGASKPEAKKPEVARKKTGQTFSSGRPSTSSDGRGAGR